MSEREFEVRIVGIDYICDECNSGVMGNRDGIMLMSNPPQWTYVCNHCGHVQTLAAGYPRIEHKRVKAD